MSGLNPVVALVLSVLIIGLSAFFVAIEFALVAARRYRLEEAAETSLSARAALRSARDLSLLLAGSQLGSPSTLALGAITKPAVHHLIDPCLTVGCPKQSPPVSSWWPGDHTFFHLVIGEMAPKSWAISTRSGRRSCWPSYAGVHVVHPARPVALNGMANWCLRRWGGGRHEVASGHSPEDLRELVEHSAKAGALIGRRAQLATALRSTPAAAEIITPKEEFAQVGPG